MDIGDLREEYTQAGLTRSMLQQDPLRQFEQWFEQARTAKVHEVNAMSLATVAADGMPQVRTVLLKSFDHKGFVFYTNYGSAKAKQLADNPQASILLPWLTLERQVRISGAVEKVSPAESFKYFSSRPKGSQLGAWISEQSSVISNRAILSKMLEQVKQRFKQGKIPLPDSWGGYRVKPQHYEFWQGRKNRLHDRFQYQKTATGWQIERLAP